MRRYCCIEHAHVVTSSTAGSVWSKPTSWTNTRTVRLQLVAPGDVVLAGLCKQRNCVCQVPERRPCRAAMSAQHSRGSDQHADSHLCYPCHPLLLPRLPCCSTWHGLSCCWRQRSTRRPASWATWQAYWRGCCMCGCWRQRCRTLCAPGGACSCRRGCG